MPLTYFAALAPLAEQYPATESREFPGDLTWLKEHVVGPEGKTKPQVYKCVGEKRCIAHTLLTLICQPSARGQLLCWWSLFWRSLWLKPFLSQAQTSSLLPFSEASLLFPLFLHHTWTLYCQRHGSTFHHLSLVPSHVELSTKFIFPVWGMPPAFSSSSKEKWLAGLESN